MREVQGQTCWAESEFDSVASFASMVQTYLNNTTTIIEANVVVTHHVHVVFLNVTKEFFRELMNHGHALASLRAVSALIKNEEERSSSGTDGHVAAIQFFNV